MLSKTIEDREYNKFRDGDKVAVTFEDVALGLRVDLVSDTLIYIGEGSFGALDSEAKWKISKVDLSSGVVIKYASNAFDKIWNDRLSYIYV